MPETLSSAATSPSSEKRPEGRETRIIDHADLIERHRAELAADSHRVTRRPRPDGGGYRRHDHGAENHRMARKTLLGWVRELVDAADAVSQRLGWQPSRAEALSKRA